MPQPCSVVCEDLWVEAMLDFAKQGNFGLRVMRCDGRSHCHSHWGGSTGEVGKVWGYNLSALATQDHCETNCLVKVLALVGNSGGVLGPRSTELETVLDFGDSLWTLDTLP